MLGMDKDKSFVVKGKYADELREAINKPHQNTKSRIMTTSNGHNKELVEWINEKWDKNKEAFHGVLCALYKRDIDEITDQYSFMEPTWRDMYVYFNLIIHILI